MRSLRLMFVALVFSVLIGGSTAWPQEKKLPRVLILGDSISLGYTEPVRKQLQGTADVYRPKENCQHTAYGLSRIKAWLGDEKWDVIHFNWGIWDTHMLSDKGALISNEAKFEGAMHIRHTPERYRENLVKLVEAMKKTGAKLIWANTTPIMSRTGKRFDDIKTLNAVAGAVMKERKIAVNDLYAFVLPKAKEWQSGDKVHFIGVGNENLAKQVSASIRLALGTKLEPHRDAATLRKIVQFATAARLIDGKFDDATRNQLTSLAAELTEYRSETEKSVLPHLAQIAQHHVRDRVLLAEIKRLGGKAIVDFDAPDWLRSIVGDAELAVFGNIVEIELNERTDGHKDPIPKKLGDRVTDDWLKNLVGQDRLRRLELSGTAVTSAGLIHLKGMRNLERLNLCLTAVDDRGFEHFADMIHMKRMVICASKITGSGFKHLQGMKEIESINLHSAPASDAGLAAIGKLTSLQRLEIVHTKVTDAGLKHLAGLVNLKQLHIHGPETTAGALPFLGQLKELYELDIYDRAASNPTLEQIARLPKLRMLMLVNGVFDDDGVKHLAKMTTLEQLTLHSSKLTDASIDHLVGLQNLRKLQLGGTKMTPAGRQRLQKLLPKTAIAF